MQSRSSGGGAADDDLRSRSRSAAEGRRLSGDTLAVRSNERASLEYRPSIADR